MMSDGMILYDMCLVVVVGVVVVVVVLSLML